MTYGVYELKDELAGYAALVDQLMENKAPLRDIITTVERGNRVYETVEDVLMDLLEGEVDVEAKAQETLEEAGFESVREAIEDRGKIRSSEPDKRVELEDRPPGIALIEAQEEYLDSVVKAWESYDTDEIILPIEEVEIDQHVDIDQDF